ncbi:MAG: RimK family alpha-L-glutamate ligase [Pseudobdellovibrionaceae bacterium]
MDQRTIYLATCEEKPQGTADDGLLKTELEQQGASAEFKIWTDPSVDWSACDLVIVRSTWDYHFKLPQFLDWASRVEQKTKLINSAALMGWNSSKTYLSELSQKGVSIVPSFFASDPATAISVVKREFLTSQALVIKPTVSASANLTYLVKDLSSAALAIESALARGEIVIQPYLPSVEQEGEISLVYFGAIFSHALIKRPKASDFRVQGDFGGHSEAFEVSPDLIDFGSSALKALSEVPAYARVDILDWNVSPKIGEIELIEPELFFRYSAKAAGNFSQLTQNPVPSAERRPLTK